MNEIGENIKNQRIKANLTQKDLADKLGVSFQTVSKYENGINEPDLATLKVMCYIFKCSLSDLVGDETNKETSTTTTETESTDEKVEETKPTVIQVGKCADCNKILYSNEFVHEMTRVAKDSNIKENVKVCNDCFVKHQSLNKQLNKVNSNINRVQTNQGNRIGAFDLSQTTVFVIATIIAVIATGGTLTYCILNYDTVGLGWTIGAPCIAAYVFFADAFCYMVGGNAGSIFFAIVSKSIKLPGILVPLTLEGLESLVVLKIVFLVLEFLLGFVLFVLGFAIASVYAAISFPYNLIHSLVTRH